MEWPLLISACRLVMLYICAKFYKISNGIKVYTLDTISIRKNTKGNSSTKNAGGATVVKLCTSSVVLYISTRFCEIISNGIKVIEWTWFLYWKLQRGIIPQKMSVEWPLFISAPFGHALYFYQVLWHYLKLYQSYRADMISILKITKRNNSAKNVGGINVVNLCTSSGHALYFCKVSWNYLE